MQDKEEIINETVAAEETAVENNADVAAEQKCEKHDKGEKKKIKKLEEALAEAEGKLADKDAQIADINDKYLRMMAEYDNFRKRSAKEKDGIYADAYTDALKGILPIIDNLDRAIEYKDADKVSKGVEMTLKGAVDALEKMGVTAFGQKGDEFDPNRHNAVMHIEDENLGEGIITEVFQKGYSKGDKIIRYAMVTVAN